MINKIAISLVLTTFW